MSHLKKCVLFATGMHKYHTHLVLHKCHTHPHAHTHAHAYAQVRTHAHPGAHTQAHTRERVQIPKTKNFLVERIRNESPTTKQNRNTTKKNRYKTTTYKIVTKNTCTINHNMQFWYQSKRLETKR